MTEGEKFRKNPEALPDPKVRRGRKRTFSTLIVYPLKLISCWVIALLLLPILLILLSPLYLFRYLVFHWAQRFRPDLGKMLNSRGAMLGCDTVYQDPKCVIVSSLILEKEPSLEKFQELLQREWIDATLADGTTPEFPELTQYISTWLGYTFWTPDRGFRIENHVKFLGSNVHALMVDEAPGEKQGPEVPEDVIKETPESLTNLMDDLVKRSFQRNRSPWEIYVVRNYFGDPQQKNPAAAIVIRWHHALMDGLSSFRLLAKVSDLSLETVAKPRRPREGKGFFGRLWSRLFFVFRIPYEAISTPITSIDHNPWHLPEEALSRHSFVMFPRSIPLEKIHQIRKVYQVSFSAVVFSFITAALRQFMISSGDKDGKQNGEKSVPKVVHVGLPFPFPGHPHKLRNHMAICTAKLPVGMEDPVERLYWLDDHLQELSDSTIPMMSFYIVPFLGSLPVGLLRELVKNKNTTVMFSNMPGPDKFQLVGEKCVAWSYTSGNGPGCVGLSMFALTYNEELRLSLVVDTSLASSQEEADQLQWGLLLEAENLLSEE